MDRDTSVRQLAARDEPWDMAVIGGGATGGVIYYDGQFDDSRLLINLAQTAEEQGAVLLNYVRVVALTHDPDGFVDGITFTDLESGKQHTARARCVINATGAFSDAIRKID